MTKIQAAIDTVEPIYVARRSKFPWKYDHEVVAFVTQAYGHMSISACLAEARARFGERAPSRSAIHRYWQWMDREIGVNGRA